MKHRNFTLAVLAALVAAAGMAPAVAQQPAAPAKAAAPAAAPAASGKELYPKAYFDTMLKDRLAQGQPDTPELRAAIREELNTRELLLREAKKKGVDKQPDVKNQMDLMGQTVLVRAYVGEWIKDHPIPDAQLKAEYDKIKTQIGDKEYKVRHILVDKEDEAKEVIVALQKGDKFEKLADRSKDPGSKAKGGDLDWNAPGNFVKPFSDAMIKLPKGKFTTQPVQTQFGWHVIMVEDIRDAKVPGFDEVKPQLAQRMQSAQLEAYFKDLRAKNGL